MYENGCGEMPALSDDGRFVAFRSDAGDSGSPGCFGCGDVSVHDRQTGETDRITDGIEGTGSERIIFFPAINSTRNPELEMKSNCWR